MLTDSDKKVKDRFFILCSDYLFMCDQKFVSGASKVYTHSFAHYTRTKEPKFLKNTHIECMHVAHPIC